MLGSLSMLLPPCLGADTEQLVVPSDACQSYSVDRDMCPPGREHIVLGLHVLPTGCVKFDQARVHAPTLGFRESRRNTSWGHRPYMCACPHPAAGAAAQHSGALQLTPVVRRTH